MFTQLGPTQRELYLRLQSHIHSSPPLPFPQLYFPDEQVTDDDEEEKEVVLADWANQGHDFYEDIALTITVANGGPATSPFSIVYLRQSRAFVIYPNLRVFDIPVASPVVRPVKP